MMWAILNTQRKPVKETSPDVGKIYLFWTKGHKRAACFNSNDAKKFSEPRIPAFIVYLFGYKREKVY